MRHYPFLFKSWNRFSPHIKKFCGKKFQNINQWGTVNTTFLYNSVNRTILSAKIAKNLIHLICGKIFLLYGVLKFPYSILLPFLIQLLDNLVPRVFSLFDIKEGAEKENLSPRLPWYQKVRKLWGRDWLLDFLRILWGKKFEKINLSCKLNTTILYNSVAGTKFLRMHI